MNHFENSTESVSHPNTVHSAKNNDVYFGLEEFKSEPIAEFTGYNTPPV